MIRTALPLAAFILTVVAFERPVSGQTVVEYGAGAGAASGTAAGSAGAKGAIGGVMGSLDKTLKSAEGQTGSSGGSSSSVAKPVTTKSKGAAKRAAGPGSKAAAPAPAPKYEDAAGIEVGMEYEEVLRRFGPPSMEFTGESNVKTLSYMGKAGSIHVECVEGKVKSAEKPKS